MNTLSVENLDQELLVFCKLYILLCADDTVILAESQENLQQSINLKGLAQAKIIKKSVILFWLLYMTI